MKKWIVMLLLIAGIGFVGYRYAYHMIGNKIMDQVADEILHSKEADELMADPEVKQMIQSSLSSKEAGRLLGSLGNQGASSGENGEAAGAKTMVVKNKDEAIKLVMSKFSIGELKGMAAKVKGGMTAEEKEEMKQRLEDRFSKDEMDSLKIIALMEAEKRNSDG
ncbi:hypothetical protein [Paenibacillus sacheonensis]|uniref:Phenylalanyl-tRNA synthetase subunit beta n=1 Tax=Paenibacillus sacheonensis TaxID=742054 RepID=A0A7X4YX45_9BACL|nr:hypothetical protein [Paenibacillus sacheonensis]MBM7567987.1 hypothetical protein [Paenibacillus sacheonensis]NBC73194.1 hypothetical protein [Paenibacillus sacheonensis]